MIRLHLVLPHIIAATVTGTYAWHLSQTALATTGLMFVFPVLLIASVHMLYNVIVRRGLPRDVQHVATASLTTIGFVFLSVISALVLTPQPAYAGIAIVEIVGMTLFCLVIVVIVCGILLVIFKAIVWLVRLLVRGSRGDRKYEAAGAIFGIIGLGLLSLEGVTPSLTFQSQQVARYSTSIPAPEHAVWDAMQTATSPQVPLPNILRNFPQPVAVDIDEGTVLGAMRRVQFAGREGSGALTLQVTEQSPGFAKFTVLSDTTPFVAWIAHQSISYDLQPHSDGTNLTVELTFERRLAPAFIMAPLMNFAGTQAMGVLARDVRDRATSG